MNTITFSPLPITSARGTEEHWLYLDEAAEAFRVAPKTLRRWIARGHVEARRVGASKLAVNVATISRPLDGLPRTPHLVPGT